MRYVHILFDSPLSDRLMFHPLILPWVTGWCVIHWFSTEWQDNWISDNHQGNCVLQIHEASSPIYQNYGYIESLHGFLELSGDLQLLFLIKINSQWLTIYRQMSGYMIRVSKQAWLAYKCTISATIFITFLFSQSTLILTSTKSSY